MSVTTLPRVALWIENPLPDFEVSDVTYRWVEVIELDHNKHFILHWKRYAYRVVLYDGIERKADVRDYVREKESTTIDHKRGHRLGLIRTVILLILRIKQRKSFGALIKHFAERRFSVIVMTVIDLFFL